MTLIPPHLAPPVPRRLTLLALALLLVGCTSLPHPTATTRAEAALPPISGTDTPAATLPALSRWWQQFDDPQLGALVEEALAGNLDIASARARVNQARALREQAAAALAPQLGLGASLTRQRSSGSTTTVLAPQLSASWELDASGQLAATERGAAADLASAEASAQASAHSVAGEVALAHVALRGNLARRALVQASLEAQQQTLQLTQWRAQAGLASTLDIEQARTSLEQTRAQLPAWDTAITQGEHALAVLLGLAPKALQARLGRDGRLPSPGEALATLDRQLEAGVPAGLLRRRPDLVAAEATIGAELARLDARQAARRPDFSLSGTLGWKALTLAALGGSGTLVATLAASVDWPVHDGGLRAAQVEAQQAVLAQARLSWRAATLAAAQDAEDSLAAAAGSRAQARALEEAVSAATQALALARQRYQAGLIDFTTLLDAQRTLLTLQTSQVGAEVELRQNLIRLFKALGGGLSAADLAALPVRAAPTR
ncbi:efflux transporter outer membrane subunit [Sphaerotilus natans]|uniref:efflux transporter outer membrane subunit n=1 Tax=Sphaerotilus natans TaxID=34103 RepID=UPI00406C0644